MKRLMVGGLALGFTAAGMLALGGPVGAQEDEAEYVELQGALSLEVAAPGEGITASSVEPCTVPDEGEPGELFWTVWAVEEFEVPEDEGVAALGADGSWSVDFTAPSEPGDYEFIAGCVPGDLAPDEERELEEYMVESSEELTEGDEPDEVPPFLIEFYYLTFGVDGGDGPGTPEPPAPPAAAPAQPVPGDPDYTG